VSDPCELQWVKRGFGAYAFNRGDPGVAWDVFHFDRAGLDGAPIENDNACCAIVVIAAFLDAAQKELFPKQFGQRGFGIHDNTSFYTIDAESPLKHKISPPITLCKSR
jgi:hypothetical protein